MNVANVVDAGDSTTRTVAAVSTKQFSRLVEASGVVALHPLEQVNGVGVIVDGEHLDLDAALMVLERAPEDEVHLLASFFLRQIERQQLVASSRVREVVDAESRDVLALYKIEDFVEVGHVVARQRGSEADPESGSDAITNVSDRFLIRALFRPKSVV